MRVRVWKKIISGAMLLSSLHAADRSAFKISPAINFDSESYFVAVFRTDMDDEDPDRILIDSGGLVRVERPELLPQHRLINATRSQLEKLVARDEVVYVFPASQDLIAGLPLSRCAGPIATDHFIGQYVLTVSPGWDGPHRGSAELSYTYTDLYRSRLPEEQVKQTLRRAMYEWSRHAAIRFTRSKTATATAERNVDFRFVNGDHHDGYAFDGPGGVLAHTFYPPGPEPLAGDVHFDADETWTGEHPDLFSVTLHELGHALGLGHGDRPGSVMYPYYRRLTSLQSEDIAALTRIYSPLERPSIQTPCDPQTLPPLLSVHAKTTDCKVFPQW